MMPVQCSQSFLSTLNVNNPANYKPCVTDWSVRVKYGRGWRILLNERAVSDRGAAQAVHKDTGYCTIQIKSAIMPDKWRTFRFKKCSNPQEMIELFP